MITGLTPATYTKLQLNAGVFIKGLDYSTLANADALATEIAAIIGGTSTGTATIMGATRGGGTFTCTPTIREVEADGKRAPFKGGLLNDGWAVKLTGTMLEITPQNFADALGSADVATSGKKTTVTVRTEFKDADYIQHLCWVGDMAGGKLVMIDLDNALNIGGANFTFTDKGEGTLPFEFQAHQASVLNQGSAPCRVVFFDKPDPPTGGG